MSKPVIAFGTLLGALILLGAGWWLGRQQTPAAVGVETAIQRDRPASAIDPAQDLGLDTDLDLAAQQSADPTAASTASRPPLPAPDTPIIAMFDTLAERARSGDARAACRLALELQRCWRAGLIGDGPRRLERLAAREEDEARRESMIDRLVQIESEQERSETVCEGLDHNQLDQAFGFQQQAAQALPELRTWAATRPALNFNNFVNELESWQQYRSNALPWLESAAAAGDTAAMIALAGLHAPRDPRHGRWPPYSLPDDERFLLYASLLEQRGINLPWLERETTRARAELEPGALARVQEQVAAAAASMPPVPPIQGADPRRLLEATPPDPGICE